METNGTDNIQALSAYISRHLEDICLSEDIPAYEAWARLSAEMLGYDPESTEFFSGNDSGVDYYTRSSQSFEVFQCKMHELDETGELQLGKSFGPEGVNDLQRAADFLLGDNTPIGIDPRLLGLREQIRDELGLLPALDEDDQAQSSVTVTFHLVTLGDRLMPSRLQR